MSSQPSNEPPRIIPLADAPAAPEPFGSHQGNPIDGAQGTPVRAFERDPLNSLKFQPQIVEAISKVFDPEIPVPAVTRGGLVYHMDVASASTVCIPDDADRAGLPVRAGGADGCRAARAPMVGLNDVKVEVVWDPPWSKERMSDAAKLTLGMFRLSRLPGLPDFRL